MNVQILCPKCGAKARPWKYVCFGPDAHTEYACQGHEGESLMDDYCGWWGRMPRYEFEGLDLPDDADLDRREIAWFNEFLYLVSVPDGSGIALMRGDPGWQAYIRGTLVRDLIGDDGDDKS